MGAVCGNCGREMRWMKRQCSCGSSDWVSEGRWEWIKHCRERDEVERLEHRIPTMESIDELRRIISEWRGSVHDMAVARLAELARGKKI